MYTKSKREKIKQQMEIFNDMLNKHIAENRPNISDIDKEVLRIYYKRNLSASVKSTQFETFKKVLSIEK